MLFLPLNHFLCFFQFQLNINRQLYQAVPFCRIIVVIFIWKTHCWLLLLKEKVAGSYIKSVYRPEITVRHKLGNQAQKSSMCTAVRSGADVPFSQRPDCPRASPACHSFRDDHATLSGLRTVWVLMHAAAKVFFFFPGINAIVWNILDMWKLENWEEGGGTWGGSKKVFWLGSWLPDLEGCLYL